MLTNEMTDKELLELAAKAAGVRITWFRDDSTPYLASKDEKPTSYIWNPLTDDGDALRLAVKLKIDIHQRVAEPRVAAVAAMHSPKIESVPDESQRLSATRAVIVRAAAEIGKNMLAAAPEYKP